jgi:hypothetical protein
VIVAATSARLSAGEEVFAGKAEKPAGARAGKAAADPAPRAAAPAPQSGPELTSVIDTVYMADGSTAEGVLVITWPAFLTSTTVQVDVGLTLASGFGVEVRANDFGWGQANDRNLLGRFSTQTFTLARLAATQDYFLRLYDSSSPPKYSRYSAALHVDYPL